MRSGPDFFGDCTQSGPESQDQTVSQSRPDWTAKSYFNPISKFGTGLLTNRSSPVRSSQSRYNYGGKRGCASVAIVVMEIVA